MHIACDSTGYASHSCCPEALRRSRSDYLLLRPAKRVMLRAVHRRWSLGMVKLKPKLFKDVARGRSEGLPCDAHAAAPPCPAFWALGLNECIDDADPRGHLAAPMP